MPLLAGSLGSGRRPHRTLEVVDVRGGCGDQSSMRNRHGTYTNGYYVATRATGRVSRTVHL
jgi:hypothetical protein